MKLVILPLNDRSSDFMYTVFFGCHQHSQIVVDLPDNIGLVVAYLYLYIIFINYN